MANHSICYEEGKDDNQSCGRYRYIGVLEMTEKTRKILETIAAQNGTTPENVEHEMIEAIRAGMASPGPA